MPWVRCAFGNVLWERGHKANPNKHQGTGRERYRWSRLEASHWARHQRLRKPRCSSSDWTRLPSSSHSTSPRQRWPSWKLRSKKSSRLLLTRGWVLGQLRSISLPLLVSVWVSDAQDNEGDDLCAGRGDGGLHPTKNCLCHLVRGERRWPHRPHSCWAGYIKPFWLKVVNTQ